MLLSKELNQPQDWDDLLEGTRLVVDRCGNKANEEQLMMPWQSFEPQALLFLRNLRRMRVRNRHNESMSEYTREDSCTIELKEAADEADVDEARLSSIVKHDFVDVETVTLQFDIFSARGVTIALSRSGNEGLPSCQVFATLPQADFGFRAIVNADWEPTKNREQINSDSTHTGSCEARFLSCLNASLAALDACCLKAATLKSRAPC